MVGFLKKLFSRRASLLALVSGDRPQSFVDALGSAEITMLADLTRRGLALESVTKDAVLAEVELAAEYLAKRLTFSPFLYEDEGVTLLPFFTSREATEAFCAAYCGRESRLFPFQAFVLNAPMLASCATPGTSVIMDPQTDNEFVLTNDQLDALRSTWNQPAGAVPRDLSEFPTSARYLIVPL